MGNVVKKILAKPPSFQSIIYPGRKAGLHNFAVNKGDPTKTVTKAIATAAVDVYQQGSETALDRFQDLLNGKKV